MRTIPVLATLALDADLVFARAWPGGWLTVTTDRMLRVLDHQLGERARHALTSIPVDATADADGAPIAAFADRLARLDGAWQQAGVFRACRWAGALVTAEAGDDQVMIARRDARTGARTAGVPIPGAWRDADVRLCAHPRGVLAWLATARERASFLVDDRATEVGPRDRPPPVFVPAGDAYLTTDGSELAYRAWPSDDELDGLSWADDDDGGDLIGDAGGDVVVYLPGGYAAWLSINGRIYLIDLAGMAVIDELALADHPLRGGRDVSVDDDAGDVPGTDLADAIAGPDDLVLTVHGARALCVSRLASWSADPARATG